MSHRDRVTCATIVHLYAGGVTMEDDWEYYRAVRPLPVLWIRDHAGRWHASAGLVPGEGRPGLAPVAGVAVGDRDPGEGRQDSALLHGLDAAGAQVERGIQLGERAVDVLLLSCGAGTERGLVEPGDRRGRDQRPDQPDGLRGQAGGLAQAGVDEPGGQRAACQVRDQELRPLDRDVLEDRE
jgi:hypothetical protein